MAGMADPPKLDYATPKRRRRRSTWRDHLVRVAIGLLPSGVEKTPGTFSPIVPPSTAPSGQSASSAPPLATQP
jgi:hypothetical protein